MQRFEEDEVLSQLTIGPLGQGHLDRAAELFCAAYKGLRESTGKVMPARWEATAEIAPLINSLHGRYPMVGAVAGGELVGFLGGMSVPELKGKDKGVYCPEWGHAVAEGLPAAQRYWIYRKMYEAIGEQWVADRRLNQAVTILAYDKTALDAWFWSTFGLLVVDAVRDLSPVDGARDDGGEQGFTVRAAVPDEDMSRMYPVLAEHEMYYTRSPIWLPKPMLTEDEAMEWVADPKSVVWIAVEKGSGDVLGMARQTIEGDDATTVVRDQGTVACTGAYVLPRARRGGVGAALLAAMVEWGRANGYARLSLDFEAANIYGSRFWLRHLRPVCYSVIRHVNDHIIGAGRDG